MTLVIGVGGGTGSGKSTIVGRLLNRFSGCVIDLDSYYNDRGDVPPKERSRVNYDEPAAIDAALLVDHLDRLTRGEAVQKPVYSFATHTRLRTEMITPTELVIVEGLFVLWWAEVRTRLDVSVFVDVPADLRLIRRIRRDVSERGRTVDQVLDQYLRTVRLMHERYVEPTRVHADVAVANDGSVESAVEHIIDAMRRKANRLMTSAAQTTRPDVTGSGPGRQATIARRDSV